MNRKLLLVSGEVQAFQLLIEVLNKNGIEVSIAENFTEVNDIHSAFQPDVTIIDSRGNELSALMLCNSLRAFSIDMNFVLIIFSDQHDDKIEINAFRSGADDFVLYPVRPEVILERIKARLKKQEPGALIKHNRDDGSPLKIDRESYSVSFGENNIHLSRKEFELLHLMASNPDKMFRQEELFTSVWNKEYSGKNRTIDVHISRLRQKLGANFISSHKGVGYRFNANNKEGPNIK